VFAFDLQGKSIEIKDYNKSTKIRSHYSMYMSKSNKLYMEFFSETGGNGMVFNESLSCTKINTIFQGNKVIYDVCGKYTKKFNSLIIETVFKDIVSGSNNSYIETIKFNLFGKCKKTSSDGSQSYYCKVSKGRRIFSKNISG